MGRVGVALRRIHFQRSRARPASSGSPASRDSANVHRLICIEACFPARMPTGAFQKGR